MCKKLTFIIPALLLVLSVSQSAKGNLVAYYPLEGDALDYSGNSYDGEAENVDWITDPERGIVASFNGTDSYISTSFIMPAFTSETDFSWMFWYKWDGIINHGVIIGNRTGGDVNLQFVKFTPNRFEFYAGTNGNTMLDYDDFPEGQWCHNVVVKEGSTLTYYRNGEVMITVEDAVEILDENNPFWIGGDEVAGEFAGGEISDVQLWDVALTQEQIAAIIPIKTAYAPNPPDMSERVPIETDLSWMPGVYAATHDVYLGDNYNDVDNATITDPECVSIGQYPNAYDPGILDYIKTYYWRIDEVSADNTTVFKGKTWEFTTDGLIANAGPDEIIEVDEPGAEVILDGSGTTDPAPGTVYFDWYEGNNYIGSGEIISHNLGFGVHTITLVATNSLGYVSEDDVVIDVRLADIVDFEITYYDNYNYETEQWDAWQSEETPLDAWDTKYLANPLSDETVFTDHAFESIDAFDLRTGMASKDGHATGGNNDWNPLESIGDDVSGQSPHHVFAALFHGLIYLEEGDVLSMTSDDDSYMFLDGETAWGQEVLSIPHLANFETDSMVVSASQAGYHTMTVKFAERRNVHSGIVINLNDEPLRNAEVLIDIKPGSFPNSINLGKKGVTPVAILSGEGFDASTVDTSSIKFTGISPLRWAMEDVDGDTDIDMILHFDTKELFLAEYSTLAYLTGKLLDGTHITGSDSVRIVPPDK